MALTAEQQNEINAIEEKRPNCNFVVLPSRHGMGY